MNSLPPVRYFVGCLLIAAFTVFIERNAHISAGGVSGLSIGIADLLHTSVGVANFFIKSMIFGFVLAYGGKATAFWTLLGAVMTSLAMWLFEMIPVDVDWSKWSAFLLILLFSKFPIGLLISKGYSTGGYTAIAQVMHQRHRIPLWITLLSLNSLSILAMYIAQGPTAGILTTILALSAGMSTQLWSTITSKLLDRQNWETSQAS
ncbi:YitT family protein [Sulfoacidibacillus thermotolerans]|uniref:YitT family protein n=1 Tax=Sulfoacidibacillus thermotolerans TaxID=1765684 RepID=A0A2U3D786_SULT2|nr:YitT family protein [Sulfoacidibacillus thermotolerans]PWI57138.1 hypothetical protein BM613_10310 [Sulfoacidibacillus thermotolerans]